MSTRNYMVFFEAFGKKMKVKMLANSEAEARQKVLDNITFHKVENMASDEFNQSMDMLSVMEQFIKGVSKK